MSRMPRPPPRGPGPLTAPALGRTARGLVHVSALVRATIYLAQQAGRGRMGEIVERLSYTPIAELEGPFHSRYFAVLESYLDESERSGINPRIFSMAGWLGDGRAWTSFQSRWDSVLREERFGVSEFKACDLANRCGEFEGWLDDRCSELLSALVEIIQTTDVIGVSVGLLLNEPEDNWAQAKRGADYIVCAAHCMVLLIHIAAIKHVEGERVAFLFDEGRSGDIESIRKKIKALLPVRLAKRVGPAGSDSSLEILPLQAADLLAYWTYLRMLEKLNRSSKRHETLLGLLSPALTSKLAIYRTLSWEPGYLQGSIEIMDPRWNIETPLPEPSLEYFMKPNMPDASRQSIWDANWDRLKRLIGGGKN